MNRSKIALLACAAILSTATFSCKKEITKQIEEHEKNQPHNSAKTVVLQLEVAELIFEDGYYTIEKQVNILTPSIVQSGFVTCHIKYDNNYLPMPISLSAVDFVEAYYNYSTNSIKFYLLGDIVAGTIIEVKLTVQP